jgi:prepilin-type N-terminal cleavage/methylation domain-containing protein
LTKGFTLIELLLGLLIFSISAVSLYSVFAAGLDVNRKFKTEGSVYREMRTTYAQMEQDFENAISYDFSASYPGRASMTGEKNKVSFLIRTSSGIKSVRYFLDDLEAQKYQVNAGGEISSIAMEKGECLVREVQDFAAFLGKTDENIDREILSCSVKPNTLAFSYRTKNPQTKKIESAGIWSQSVLPGVIRAYMVFDAGKKDGDKPVYRDLFIPAQQQAL